MGPNQHSENGQGMYRAAAHAPGSPTVYPIPCGFCLGVSCVWFLQSTRYYPAQTKHVIIAPPITGTPGVFATLATSGIGCCYCSSSGLEMQSIRLNRKTNVFKEPDVFDLDILVNC